MNNINQQMLDAALSDDLATVEKLVKEGADINYKDAWENSAVFSAAWEGNSPLWDYIIPGYSLQFELQMYVEAGMTPYEALKTATVNPAVYLHLEKNFGTVEQGKIANLVLLDANPLLDIANTRKINAVIVNGKFLKHSDLDTLIQQAEIQITQQRQTK